ncbi:MAG: histidine phosphatase family protein [Gaiellaceae bacterium]
MRGAALALACLALAGCGGGATPAAEDARLGPAQLVQALQEGGLVVYLRHAATDQSQDDAGLADLDDCSKQRNLDESGREQSREIGRAFRALELPVGDVLTSEYCRTRETAELAFGRYADEPVLTGFPGKGDPGYAARVTRTQALLGAPPEKGNTVLVAHVKNLEAAAKLTIEEGDAAVFEPLGEGRFRYLGRIPASAWPQLVAELSSP